MPRFFASANSDKATVVSNKAQRAATIAAYADYAQPVAYDGAAAYPRQDDGVAPPPSRFGVKRRKQSSHEIEVMETRLKELEDQLNEKERQKEAYRVTNQELRSHIQLYKEQIDALKEDNDDKYFDDDARVSLDIRRLEDEVVALSEANDELKGGLHREQRESACLREELNRTARLAEARQLELEELTNSATKGSAVPTSAVIEMLEKLNEEIQQASLTLTEELSLSTKNECELESNALEPIIGEMADLLRDSEAENKLPLLRLSLEACFTYQVAKIVPCCDLAVLDVRPRLVGNQDGNDVNDIEGTTENGRNLTGAQTVALSFTTVSAINDSLVNALIVAGCGRALASSHIGNHSRIITRLVGLSFDANKTACERFTSGDLEIITFRAGKPFNPSIMESIDDMPSNSRDKVLCTSLLGVGQREGRWNIMLLKPKVVSETAVNGLCEGRFRATEAERNESPGEFDAAHPIAFVKLSVNPMEDK